MKLATQADRDIVIHILSSSFKDNKSVNYIIPQDSKKKDRIRTLMAYSFDICSQFGEVLLSDDKNGCALIVYPDKKKITLKSILWDLKLIMKCTGISNIKKTVNRESKIKQLHPDITFSYLWFIGVGIGEQNRGVGSKLLQEIVVKSEKSGRAICLETSNKKNLPWYKKHGFTIYNELDLGYRLFFLRNG